MSTRLTQRLLHSMCSTNCSRGLKKQGAHCPSHRAARPVRLGRVLSAQSQARRRDAGLRGRTQALGQSSPGTPPLPPARPHSPGSGRFPRRPARRATYPRPLTRPGPPPLAQSQRRLLGGSRRAGGASGARARGPDVRPAERAGGEGAPSPRAGHGGRRGVSAPSDRKPSHAEGKTTTQPGKP